MSKKRKEDVPEPGSPAWMATFGDLMNLLLCFFVLLFSMSTVDAQKFEMIVESFSQTFSVFKAGAATIGDEVFITNGMEQLTELDEYMNSIGKVDEGQGSVGSESQTIEEIKEQLEDEKLKESEKLAEQIESALAASGIEHQVDVSFNSQYVLLVLNGALLFDNSSAKLKDEAKDTLAKVGKILETYAESVIEVEGHTDNLQIHNAQFANNNELSSARALSAFDFFVAETNLDPAMIKHSGRGEYQPIADNSTEEGRALNRRVEIKVYHSLSSY